MKLISCKIFDFGKLHDRDISFSDGLNTVNEPNGWGKSTLTAFIKAMLYGLEGDGKRDDLASDRRHYKPWQGGTFGGSMDFEVKGKCYRVTRTFGPKAGTDTFELRDASTLLVSDDYSEKLGEELFNINAESFARTFFISQNSSEYHKATDDINAKLGNISDSMDINLFASIDDHIKDRLNALSAGRKTGEIYKLKEAATDLKAKIRECDGAGQGAELVKSRLEANKESINELTLEKQKLSESRKKASLYAKIKADRDTLESLKKDLMVKEEAYNKALESLGYQGAGDSGDAIANIMDLTSQLSENGKIMAAYALTEDEQKALDSYSARLGDPELIKQQTYAAINDIFSSNSYNKALSEKEKALSDLEFDNEEAIRKKKSLGFMLFADFLSLALALVTVIFKEHFAYAYFAAAAFAVIFCILTIVFFVKRRNVVRDIEVRSSRIDKLKEEIKEAEDFVSTAYMNAERLLKENGIPFDPGSAVADLKKLYHDCFEYKALSDKFNKFKENDKTDICTGLSTRILSYFKDFGLSPDESEYNAVLSSLIRKNEAVKTQKELYNDSFDRLREFEKNNDTEALLKETDESVIGIDEIDHQEREIEDKLDTLRKNSEIDRRQLESLNERLDEAADLSDRLDEIDSLIREKNETVGLLEETRAFLNKARENLTARYIGPLKAGFERYYSLITGSNADDYMLDANLDLTVTGGGLQHSIGYLSYGYRDLVGVCMRLALADAMYPEEKPMLILDDPFVNLDEHNREGAFKLLECVSHNYQIVHFSCR